MKKKIEASVSPRHPPDTGQTTPLDGKQKVKVTFLLTQEEVALLQQFAQTDGATASETLRRVIRSEGQMRKLLADGARFYLREEGNEELTRVMRW